MNINKKISNFNHYNGNKGIKFLVIHSTGNNGDTAKNNVDYFSRANRGSSAHFFVDDNSIWQSVEEYNSAWHVGDGHGMYGITNMNSIGIEMCGTNKGNISNTTIDNTIELTKYLMKKYNININNVVRHYDASRKLCPYQFQNNNWLRWHEFKKKLKGDDFNMDKIVTYFGEGDIPAALILSQKYKCGLIKESDLGDIKAKEIIKIGGPNGTITGNDRFKTFKNVANKL